MNPEYKKLIDALILITGRPQEFGENLLRGLISRGYTICPAANVIEPDGWTRLTEVDQYAEANGIDRGEAIMHLVNSGLSNWPHDYEPASAAEFYARGGGTTRGDGGF